MSNLGVNMQKFSHTQTLNAKNKKSPYKHPLWMCGLVLLVVGSLADLVSFGFADMSLLAPLGAMTLVVNLFIAPCFNGENLSKKDVFFTGVILGGTILSISFGNKESKNYTLDELIVLYQKKPFIAYVIFFCFYMTCAFWYLRNLRKRRILGTPRSYDARLESVAYPSLAGTFGAHSVLFAKSTAEIVKQTARGENQFVNFASYFIIFFLFAFLFLQMRILNEGLSKADALVIVPVYQVCWVTMNTVVGMVYFEDYKEMIPWHTALFLLGVGITLVGVFLLSKRDGSATKSPIQEEEGGYIEEVVSSLDDDLPGSDVDLPPTQEVLLPDSLNSSTSRIQLAKTSLVTTEKPLDIGDVEAEEEEEVGNIDPHSLDVHGISPINHPPKSATRNHSRSFSLSWSWWARGGTRKLYTPLF